MTIHHRTATAAAIFVSLAAAGVPPAAARPAHFVPAGDRAPTFVYSRQDREMIPVTSPATYGVAAARYGVAPPAGHQPGASPAIAPVQTPQSGFDWGDAGIGAAGGVALLTLGLGGALVIAQRRPRRSHHNPALPG